MGSANRTQWADRLILFSTFALLLFGPLAFGATEAWARFVIEAGAALLLLAWGLRCFYAGEIAVVLNPLFVPMLAFAALILAQLATSHSAYKEATIGAAVLYAAYGILCFLVVQCFTRTSHLTSATTVFIAYGAFVAMFALFQSLSSGGRLYWVQTSSTGGWIYGPYVNHNHYAGLMELLAPPALVFAFTRRAKGGRKIMAIVAASIMTCTIFLSGSRGGILAFCFQMLIFSCFLARKRQHRRTLLGLGVFLLISAGTLTWIGGNQLISRIASLCSEAHSEISGGTRLQIDRDTLRMFSQRPVMGWGLGDFAGVYPKFRSFHSQFYVNAAHNDYLQFMAETGLLGFMTVLWFLWTVYRNALKKASDWQKDINGALAVAMILSISGLLAHSLTDFNLQIPANAALFYVFCTIATMPPRFYTRQHRRPMGDSFENFENAGTKG